MIWVAVLGMILQTGVTIVSWREGIREKQEGEEFLKSLRENKDA